MSLLAHQIVIPDTNNSYFLLGINLTDTAHGQKVNFQLSLVEEDLRCSSMHYFRQKLAPM